MSLSQIPDPKSSPRFHSRLAPWLIAAVAVAAFAASMVLGPQYSQFTASLVNLAELLLAIVAFDALFLRRSSTWREIVQEKNVAYASFLGLVVVGMAIVIAAG